MSGTRRGAIRPGPAAGERASRGWHGFGRHHPEAGEVRAVFPRAAEVPLDAAVQAGSAS